MNFDILYGSKDADSLLHYEIARSGAKRSRKAKIEVRAQTYAPYEQRDGVPGHGKPRHLAIIMDGNGRWASQRGHLASVGHKAGIEALQTAVEGCIDIGIKYLSVFALSAENSTSRNEQEVNFLVTLVHSVVHERLVHLHTEGVRLKFIGDIHSLNNNSLWEIIQQYVSMHTLDIYLNEFKCFVRQIQGGKTDRAQ